MGKLPELRANASCYVNLVGNIGNLFTALAATVWDSAELEADQTCSRAYETHMRHSVICDMD